MAHLHMPDIELRNVPPAALAALDQQLAIACAEVDEWVGDARRFLDRFGPVFGPGLLAESLIAGTRRDVDALAGALGIALVELARREAT